MPRKSAAELSVVQLAKHHKPPKPSPDLHPKVKTIFEQVLATSPFRQFNESDRDLLERYAEAIYTARRNHAMVVKHGSTHNNRLSPYFTAWEKAEKLVIMLSTRLRLSPQSRYDRKSSRLHPDDPRTPPDQLLDDDD